MLPPDGINQQLIVPNCFTVSFLEGNRGVQKKSGAADGERAN